MGIRATKKIHTVALGATRKVPYSKAGDPTGMLPGEDSLKIRPLVVDSSGKEWTTSERPRNGTETARLRPGVNQVSWFRDYGAYCGVTASGKSVYAVAA